MKCYYYYNDVKDRSCAAKIRDFFETAKFYSLPCAFPTHRFLLAFRRERVISSDLMPLIPEKVQCVISVMCHECQEGISI